MHAGSHHHGQAVAGDHGGTRVAHVGAVTELHFGGDGVRLLLNRLGFPGEVRLGSLQLGHVQEAHIGLDEVAGFQANNVARHQGGGGDGEPLTVAAHRGVVIGHGFQRRQGFLRALGLPKPEGGIHPDQKQDGDAFVNGRHAVRLVAGDEEIVTGAGPGEDHGDK